MKIAKLIKATTATILLLVSLAVVLVNLLPADRYKHLLTTAVQSATGRELQIGGEFSVSLTSHFSLTAENASLSNADWGSRAQMFTSEQIHAEIPLFPLLRGVLDLRLTLIKPDLLLETDSNGNGNWLFDDTPPPKQANEQAAESLLRPVIREIRLEQATIAYLDGQTKKQHQGKFTSVLIASQDPHQDLANSGGLTTNGAPLRLEIEAASIKDIAGLTGLPIDDDRPIHLQGTIQRLPKHYKADRIQWLIGNLTVEGNATYTPATGERERPSLSADLQLGRLDLEPYFNIAEPQKNREKQPESPPKEQVFSTQPLPVDLLRRLDADININADEVASRDVVLHDVAAHLRLRNGVLSIAPKASVGSGSFRANLQLNAADSPPTLSANVDMENGTFRHFGGRYNLKLRSTGRGDSQAALMAGLNGHLTVDIRNLDLDKSFMTQFGRGLIDSLNPFEKSTDRSHLVCAVAHFDIRNGLANAKDNIVAQMEKVTWFGGGEINFKTETIDFGAKPKPRKGLVINTGELASIVRVGGTLATPGMRLDAKDIVQQYGQLYLTAASGGLWLLGKGAWDKSQANSDVCTRILEAAHKAPASAAEVPATPKPAPPKGEPANRQMEFLDH